MDNETREMFQMLLQGMEKMENGLRAEIGETNRRVTRVATMIENDITKRLDALVDGYKGNYERQEELAQDLEDVKRRVDRLENIAG